MNMKLALATLLLAAAGTTQAASLRLVPSADTVVQGATFTVDVVLDAPDALRDLVSGAIIVDFNRTLLDYNGFALTAPLSFYAPVSTATSGNTQTVSFGFQDAPEVGTVGTFSFTAIGSPGSIATLGLIDADDFAGSFVYMAPTNQRFDLDFIGTEIRIAAVPLPATVWLLGTAVGALVVRRRFRSIAA